MEKRIEDYIVTDEKEYEALRNPLMEEILSLRAETKELCKKMNQYRENNGAAYMKTLSEYGKRLDELLMKEYMLDVLWISFSMKKTDMADIRRCMILNKYYTPTGALNEVGYFFPDGTIVNQDFSVPKASLYELYFENKDDMRRYYPIWSRCNGNIHYAKFLCDRELYQL